MTHCTAEAARPSSPWMDGKATLTMLKSRTTMNDATRMRVNPRLRRASAGNSMPPGGRLGAPSGRSSRLLERDWPGGNMAGVTGPAVEDSLTGAGVDIRPPLKYDTFRF